jgi:hypothetical protein
MIIRHTKMKFIFYLFGLVAIMVVVFRSVSMATSTTNVGSKHDFSASNASGPGHFAGYWQIGVLSDLGPLIDDICDFCHTPHGTSEDPQTCTRLWNRISSPPAGYSYKPYSSASMTNPAQIRQIENLPG